MLCEHCQKNEATVHLTQVVDDDVKKLHLCEECSAKSGFDMDGPVSITDLMLGLGAAEKNGETDQTARKACPACGLTVAEFRKKGRLGCSECYESFKRELMPLMKSMHHSTKHIGKVPAGIHEKIRHDSEIENLEKKLEEAIAAEEFESAAEIRDRIAGLRSDGKGKD